MRWQRIVIMCAMLAVAACDPALSALDPAGPQAERISDLTRMMTGILTAVFVIVMGFLGYALRRGSRRIENAHGEDAERQLRTWVGGSVAVTAVILLGLLVTNFATGRALANFADRDALSVKVYGQQWWWEFEYQDPVAARRALTANELIVPVGRKVRLITESRDVIHSLWAPQLHGKLDLIPGRRGTTYIQADSQGIFIGKCAEYCGLQHARMDFRVIAVAADSFAAWYENQLEPAAPPADALQQHGLDVFLSRSCAMCHNIRGTVAGSRLGPDLTHLASRRTIAAGTLPNTRGHLAGWISDPQRIKPGARMPPNQLAGPELNALLDYLQNLK